MGWIQKLGRLIARDSRMRERGEQDAPTDPAHGTRESADGTYVGRAGSDETADPGVSGAEARAGGAVSDRSGAGRDESGPRQTGPGSAAQGG
jgi:hypothetical protein